ncbi:hypothetical protein VIGAN_11148500 [Vigna angularis var. angularis]|uniref:Uncharacterized protein n=1 Tax=Vigna angularis var. angularis TaxID=157739 RepID=A0A0S3TAR1_PHAAN|nr:hypothetical protein VIGAN_11148500 [Vigna angularis var. angularis]
MQKKLQNSEKWQRIERMQWNFWMHGRHRRSTSGIPSFSLNRSVSSSERNNFGIASIFFYGAFRVLEDLFLEKVERLSDHRIPLLPSHPSPLPFQLSAHESKQGIIGFDGLPISKRSARGRVGFQGKAKARMERSSRTSNGDGGTVIHKWGSMVLSNSEREKETEITWGEGSELKWRAGCFREYGFWENGRGKSQFLISTCPCLYRWPNTFGKLVVHYRRA